MKKKTLIVSCAAVLMFPPSLVNAFDEIKSQKKIIEVVEKEEQSESESEINFTINTQGRKEELTQVEELNEEAVNLEAQSYSVTTTQIRTANEIYELAVKETSVTRKFNLYLEGYKNYPEDTRFSEGVISSGFLLLNWARGQHNKNDFETAIDRYTRILNAPGINSTLRISTEKHLDFARKNKHVSSANDLLQIANLQTQVSARFTRFLDAFQWYPEDKRIESGFQASAQALFDWSVRQHDLGNYETAISRYETLISEKEINKELLDKVESRLADAKIGKRPANVINNLAIAEGSASRKLALHLEGYGFYPSDTRFINGVRSSAQLLFNWAKGQHNNRNFETAIDRYRTIINISILEESLINSSKKHLEYAEAHKVVPSADSLFNTATKQTTVSGIFNAYVTGYELYPTDQRFVNGLQTSAESLFVWATRQHDIGNYETATNRYETIIATTGINNNLIQRVENRLQDARIGKRSANIIFNEAVTETSATRKLTLFIEGYEFYPNDVRFIDGMKSSAQGLYSWTTNQHNIGNIDVAVGRYEFILSTPILSDDVKNKTTIQLKFARDNVKIPTPEEFNTLSLKESTISARLAILLDGYTLYGNNSTIIEGINTTARDLLVWATRQHENGEYEVARSRYETIMNTPGVSTQIIEEVSLKYSYAINNKKLPSADELYLFASQQTSATQMLLANLEGYTLYPQDTRFIEGLKSSGDALLRWATTQHGNGNFSTARDRYQRILSTPEVTLETKREAEIKLKYATQNQHIPTANQLHNLANGNTTLSGQLNLYIEGVILYPDDQRFQIGVNSSAMGLLDWSRAQHERRNFATAIQRYETILNAPGVSASIKELTSRLLSLAESGQLPLREFITYTQYNVTFDQSLATQMAMSVPPQTDKYRNSAAYVHSSFVTNVIQDRGAANTSSNLRRTPSLGGTVFETVSAGTTFIVEGTEKGDMWNGSDIWYKIKYKDQTLYIHSNLATIASVGTVSERANVFEGTNSTSHIFGSRQANAEVVILKEVTGTSWRGSNKWYEITFGAWRNAKQNDVVPVLNPNNNDIFQHLVLSTSAGVSVTQINKLLNGRGILHGKGQTFIDAGLMHSVNEVYLISHALLETGNGQSTLATGIEVGRNSSGNLELVTTSNRGRLTNIRTTYNMFGIGAVDSDPYRQGAFRAYNEQWFTPEAAIIGGTKFIGSRYIHNSHNQNTLYKMRWNPANPGFPQYATDMEWAIKQIFNIKRLYDELEDPILHFDIPRYR